MPKTIQSIKDLLLPGLHCKCAYHGVGEFWDLDITDGDSVQLISSDHRSTLFTRKEIEDNEYKTLFAPRLDKIFSELKNKNG